MKVLKLNICVDHVNNKKVTIQSNVIISKLEKELLKRLICLQFPFIYKKYQKNKELQNCYVSFSPMYVESGSKQILCFEEYGEDDYYQVDCGDYSYKIIQDMENYLNDVLTEALGV